MKGMGKVSTSLPTELSEEELRVLIMPSRISTITLFTPFTGRSHLSKAPESWALGVSDFEYC